MVLILITIGAVFFIAGKAFGLASVFVGLKFQYFLYSEHKDIFDRLSVSGEVCGDNERRTINSASLWRYIKSAEDDPVAKIFRYKNKIKRYFLLFAIFCMIGISSFIAAVVVLLARG